MHCLEHMLFVASVAVENDAISKAELVSLLKALAGASHTYDPVPYTYPDPHGPRNADEALAPMSDEFGRRFRHLMST